MDKSKKQDANDKGAYSTHFCFFIHSTDSTDNDEDAEVDKKNWADYMKRHPKDGNGVWNNHKDGIKHIYLKNIENCYLLYQEGALEEELIVALNILHSEKEFLKSDMESFKCGYYYAWIKYAIDKELFNGSSKLESKSMPDFKAMIIRLGFKDICAEETLNKMYQSINGTYPNFSFSDSKGRTNNERNRRNKFIRLFVEKMREIRGSQ